MATQPTLMGYPMLSSVPLAESPPAPIPDPKVETTEKYLVAESFPEPKAEATEQVGTQLHRRHLRLGLVAGGLVATAALVGTVRSRSAAPAPSRSALPTEPSVTPPADDHSRSLAELEAVLSQPVLSEEPSSQRSVALGSGSCRIQVGSKISDGEVWIGDRPLGTLPLEVNGLRCGWPVAVVVRRAQFAPWKRTVTLREGEIAVLTPSFERPPTWLTVESSPPGAWVRVNGHVAGATPIRVETRAFTTSVVEMQKAGYQPLRRSVSASIDGQTVLHATLETTQP